MTRLKERIKSQIALSGPLNVAEFMALCLLDPLDGYYTTRQPFGAAGDFTTAPEVSQMFGELVGVWLHAAWEACGGPPGAVLAEIGAGRGTLMADICRTLRRLDGAWFETLGIAMVEASPRLAATQRETLGAHAGKATWLPTVSALPDRPLLVVGNEFFDALPVRQYQFVGGVWRERLVGLDEADGIAFLLGPGAPDPLLLPRDARARPEGTVVELSPAREAAAGALAARIAAQGGVGLFIDYGSLERGFGDTLQAVRRHAFDDVLAHPGEADLTAHVDFSALAEAAHGEGLAAWAATQGEFLLGLGLLERAGALGAGADEAQREHIRGEVERLAGPQAMGTLFKVLAFARPETALPALKPFGAAPLP